MMKNSPGFLTYSALAFVVLLCLNVCKENGRVRLGNEAFLENHLDLVKGKQVGLITNPTGVDGKLNSMVKLFFHHPDINLVALYGPEHGVRGNAQAGEYVPFYVDEKYGLPVFSLYGQTERPDPGMLNNIDEYMRSFDTQKTGKIPESSQLLSIDVMIFDMQDVGTRVYTYIATMAYCMQVCSESDIEFIVLDRPNPINGLDMEGPLLKYPEFSSFVGLYPIPLRHGMTVGELALLFNDRFLEKQVDLTVVAMEGWSRHMWYDETNLPWVIPSPNMPTLDTATVYPGQVFLEGTNLSEGRGTTRPFELFGAPWIDGHELSQRLNDLDLPGVKFREAWFAPIFSKFEGEICGGAQVHVINREEYKPMATTILIIKTIKDMYPKNFEFHAEYFDKIMGTSFVRKALEEGEKVENIVARFADDVKNFAKTRKPCLLY